MQAGPISDVATLEELLAGCWNEFEGSDAEGMLGNKLQGRMEDVVWEPPILQFHIERHGGTALGSSRAEIHQWQINVDKRSANCCNTSHRQVRRMQSRQDVKSKAREIVDRIVNNREDEHLKWNDDGSVRILIGKIIPDEFIAKQTLQGRRKRFRKEVDEQLGSRGWQKIRENVYAPP
jgi:hypothetical protein